MLANEDEDEVAHAAMQRMDEYLAEAEKSILAYHSARLTKWTREQQLALQRAAELDGGAMQTRLSACGSGIQGLKDDAEMQAEERAQTRARVVESRGLREAKFHAELRELGDERAAEASECVRRCTESLRHASEDWEERAWMQVESNLTAMAWKKARGVRSLNMPNSVAEVFQKGELQPYLDAERDGWARSQETDLERLRKDIDSETEGVFQALVNRLKHDEPGHMLVSPGLLEELAEMAASQSKRLGDLEKEVMAAYSADIDAAVLRVEEDYRGFDCDLQEVVFRTLEQRFNNACAMRQLKLALCRWRLDYQRAYHDQCTRLVAQSHSEEAKDTFNAKDRLEIDRNQQARDQASLAKGKQQLEKLRKAMLRSWAQGKVPLSEMHAFIVRVGDSLARDEKADGLLSMYNEELKQYGAIPLLEHASNPEVLNCWLDSLMLGTKDDPQRKSRYTVT